MIGGPAHHDAVQRHPVADVEMGLGLVQRGNAAVDRDRKMGPLALQTPHQRVVERRHVAVLFRRQALQPGHAGVDDKDLDPDGSAGVDGGEQRDLRVLVVDADAAFDGGGHGDRFLDRGHAVGDQSGLAHQAGAEPARLDPVGGAADVQIDLVIAKGLADPRGLGQLGRVRAAQLQGHGMFDGVEAQQPLLVAVQHRRSGDHLGIEQCLGRQGAMERPAMPVGPVHHGRDRETAVHRARALHQSGRGRDCQAPALSRSSSSSSTSAASSLRAWPSRRGLT